VIMVSNFAGHIIILTVQNVLFIWRVVALGRTQDQSRLFYPVSLVTLFERLILFVHFGLPAALIAWGIGSALSSSVFTLGLWMYGSMIIGVHGTWNGLLHAIATAHPHAIFVTYSSVRLTVSSWLGLTVFPLFLWTLLFTPLVDWRAFPLLALSLHVCNSLTTLWLYITACFALARPLKGVTPLNGVAWTTRTGTVAPAFVFWSSINHNALVFALVRTLVWWPLVGIHYVIPHPSFTVTVRMYYLLFCMCDLIDAFTYGFQFLPYWRDYRHLPVVWGDLLVHRKIPGVDQFTVPAEYSQEHPPYPLVLQKHTLLVQ